MAMHAFKLVKFASALLFVASFPAAFGQQSEAVHKNEDAGGAPLLYSDGGGFLIESPKGWIIDREVGKRLGTCCVFYPKDSTWDNAVTVMYPSIATKGPGQQTVKDFMESDLAEFRQHDPEVSYEDAEDVSLKLKRTAKIRKFYNVNRGSSEAVAYIDEEKIIALVVVSSKTKKDLQEAMPLLRSALETYVYMDVKVDGAQTQKEGPTSPAKK